MILAALTTDNMFMDEDIYEAEDMGETLLSSAVSTLGTLEVTPVEYDVTGDEVTLCGTTPIKHVVSWADVRAFSSKDATIQSVLHLLQGGWSADTG